jgi:hypothetical protein
VDHGKITAGNEQTMRPESAPRPRRRWLQFSLRSMLVLVVLASIGFSLWTSNERLKENRRLRSENKQLRDQLGIITIEEEDKHKIHAIEMPTKEVDHWKWRVYIPRSGVFQLMAKFRDEQEESISKPMPAGEYIVEVTLEENKPDEKPRWLIESRGDSSSSMQTQGVSGKLAEVMAKGGFSYGTGGVEESAMCVDPGEDLPLFHFRVIGQPESANEIEVWIRENLPQ